LPLPRGWRPPDEAARPLPVAGLTWGQAALFAAWAGKSLPTLAQWEWAARGDRAWPWGDRYEPGRARHRAALQPVPSGPVAAGGGGYEPAARGLLHAAGNVWEWLADPHPAAPRHRLIAGGGFRSPPAELRPGRWDAFREDAGRDDIGLRCAFTGRK
jgi:formylglycine-generating enzyme required for sulfatase activity